MKFHPTLKIGTPQAIIIAGVLVAVGLIGSQAIKAWGGAGQERAASNDPKQAALEAAKEAGAKVKKIEACLKDEATDTAIQAHVANAQSLGVTGTPYHILIGSNGDRFALPGALPQNIFEEVIKIMKAGTPRGSVTLAAEDIQGIAGYIRAQHKLPKIKGDTTSLLTAPTESDVRRGGADAKVTIIEFSDFECPFCARDDSTLKKVLEKDPEVAWIYRHFPLTQLHKGAMIKAEVAECVRMTAGNDAFWKYADELFDEINNAQQ